MVLEDPAYASEPFSVHTRWIETEFNNTIAPYEDRPTFDGEQPAGRQTVVIEVEGRRVEISLPTLAGESAVFGRSGAGDGAKARPRAVKRARSAPSGDALLSPMQGTIVKVAVADGQPVEAGQPVVVLEAMKMEQPITAHRSGTVSGLSAEVGGSVSAGAVICQISG
ncbi:acetyl-CoA/propionyl-CoA carboxylase, biotin carboxylase, biotin carboxyl carrier protein [Thermomonospora echinospora]|uniref:Acetyl-CoA/propionyl-CoA carboxylase, biotin carboxylase, biotin carboxyl carrier protein n=1 Tax=Thermomonospora echinospora TaxID=1992 RepID=A0A1H6D8P0_9ACTN|nr:acetyl-CoA/propionyl-CoA carboxylase, biotin carboxylase, biotin carboxyl carrier protein [Thermomonospora echinospora]